MSNKYITWVPFALIALFACLAVAFSYHQNLWVDESTQLSGLTLPAMDIYRWLGNMIEHPFLVPADRMPVLGYWTGLLWGNVFGFEPLTMRWLSVFFVVMGLLAIAIYLLRERHYAVLCFTLTFLCLSPNLLVIAVEIRSYALFFFLSTVAAIFYVDIIRSALSGHDVYGKIIGLTIVLALAINTHFFGVVLCGSILGSYLILSFFNRHFVITVKMMLIVGAILLVALAFVIPPLLASFASSEGDGIAAESSWLRPAIKLIYRLVAHNSVGEIAFFPMVALVTCYALIVFSLVKRMGVLKITMLLVLGLGFTVSFMANFILPGFDALSPHYNIWMMPFLALLFGFCLYDSSKSICIVVITALAITLGFGQYNLAINGKKFAHTRFHEIQQRVDEHRESNRVAVIYNHPMAKTWFAGLYSFSASVGQYTATNNGYMDLYTNKRVSKSEIEESSDVIVVAYGEDVYSDDLAQGVANTPLPADSPVYLQVELDNTIWNIIDSGSYLAQESADIVVYKKSP